MKTVIKTDIIEALREVGLKTGDPVMVHASLSRIGYVCGGAELKLMKQRELVDFAVEWIEKNRKL